MTQIKDKVTYIRRLRFPSHTMSEFGKTFSLTIADPVELNIERIQIVQLLRPVGFIQAAQIKRQLNF